METLSLETLLRLYGENIDAASLIQIKLSYQEWLKKAAACRELTDQQFLEDAESWLIRHSVLCDAGVILVI